MVVGGVHPTALFSSRTHGMSPLIQNQATQPPGVAPNSQAHMSAAIGLAIPWARISCAKHRAQNGICCSGFSRGTMKKYTRRRRMSIYASVLWGAPVRGFVQAAIIKCCMSSAFVVANTGADPRYWMWPLCPGRFCGRATGTARIEPEALRRVGDDGPVEAPIVQEHDLLAWQVEERKVSALG